MDSRWLILRDLDIFPPNHHQLVVCQRDLSVEIMSGQKERRHEYVIDHWTGRSWGRVGTGKYLKWSAVPPASAMISSDIRPVNNNHIIICCRMPQFFGIRIGKYEGGWRIYSDILVDWINVSGSYVEGWLPLI